LCLAVNSNLPHLHASGGLKTGFTDLTTCQQ